MRSGEGLGTLEGADTSETVADNFEGTDLGHSATTQRGADDTAVVFSEGDVGRTGGTAGTGPEDTDVFTTSFRQVNNFAFDDNLVQRFVELVKEFLGLLDSSGGTLEDQGGRRASTFI